MSAWGGRAGCVPPPIPRLFVRCPRAARAASQGDGTARLAVFASSKGRLTQSAGRNRRGSRSCRSCVLRPGVALDASWVRAREGVTRMRSLWSSADAERMVERYAEEGVARDLALRVYTSRMLGCDPRLVLHGGGNTSVKTVMKDLLDEEVEVLCVKGSGWDMAAIEPAGLPAVRLAPLRKLRGRAVLADEEMVRVRRANPLDPGAPNPSVETLLHAFLPHKYIDHTHSTAVLSLADQPDAAERCADLYGGRMGLVPYIMPGFLLAKKAAEVFEADPAVEGLVLLKHGIFTFADTAQEAYERMIAAVSLAEERLAHRRKTVFAAARLPNVLAAAAEVAPILRGACAIAGPAGSGSYKRFVLDFRSSAAVLNYVNGAELERYGRAGVATPDHTIRTKN